MRRRGSAGNLEHVKDLGEDKVMKQQTYSTAADREKQARFLLESIGFC